MVLLEAQTFRKCPSSRVITAALPAWCKHGETGILTPPGDVNAFARSVGSLIRDAIASASDGRAGARLRCRASETSRKRPCAFAPRCCRSSKRRAHEQAGPHRGDAPSGGRAPHPRGGSCARFRGGGSCGHAGFRRHADFASRAGQRHVRPASAGANRGTDFRKLLDEQGTPITAKVAEARGAILHETIGRARPDVLITELFPFGRRVLAEEFLAVLHQAHAMRPRPLVLSSIRDILVAPKSRADCRDGGAHR